MKNFNLLSKFNLVIDESKLKENDGYYAVECSHEDGLKISSLASNIIKENFYEHNDKIRIIYPKYDLCDIILITNIKRNFTFSFFIESDRTSVLFKKKCYEALEKDPNLFNFDSTND